MAGFADLPIDGSHFAQPTAAPTTAPAPTPSNGGLLGAIYNHTLGPIANAVGGGLSDIPKLGESAVNLAKISTAAATGNKTALANAKTAQDKVLAKSNFQNKYEDPNLEKAFGKSAGQVLNILSPVAGAGSLAGKTGLRLIGAGIGVGGKLGAAGGVSNAMAQGGNGEQIFSSGVTGAGEGGLAGGIGGGIGAGLASGAGRSLVSGGGKLASGVMEGLTGRAPAAAADEAGAGAAAASGNQGSPGGLFPNAATRAGGRAAQADKAAQATDFAGASKGDIDGTMSYDKGGNPIGLSQVSSFLRGNDMPAHAQNMENASNFMKGAIGGHLSDITDGVPVNVGSPADVARTSIIKKSGTIGSFPKRGVAGAAGDTLAQVRSATENLDSNSTVSDVLHSVSQLESAKNDLGTAAAMGDAKAKAQVGVYQDVINHLHSALDSSGVNKAVSQFKVSPQEEATIRQDAIDSSVSPKMGQHVIDTLDNAKNYGDLKTAIQPAVVMGNLSRVAKETFANAVPKAGKNTTLGVPSWELAMSLHNPAYLAAAGARLATHTGIADKVLGKVNPGAFNAGETAGLAPDQITAQKLAQPGGGPATPAPGEVPPVQGAIAAPPPTAPAAVPGPIGQAMQAAGGVLSQAKPGLLGAATGEAANQVGQQLAGPVAPIPGGLDTSGIDNVLNSSSDAGGPTLDASTIPGGTIQDLEAEIQADPKNASIYQSIYDEAQKQVAASAPQKLNATEAKNLTNIQNATAALSNYVTGLNSLSTATRGAGVGKLSSLLGHLGIGGDDAKTAARLESSKEELAIQLAQAMNNGTKPQGAQIDQIKAMLPSVNDPKNLATAKIEQLSQNMTDYLRIATSASVANRTSGNTSDLLSQLTGGQ